MFGISLEHLLIAGIILLIFGPKKIPEVARTLGKSVRNFKDHFNGIHEPEYRRIETPEEDKKHVG